MTSHPLPTTPTSTSHELWLHTRLLLEAAFRETLRHGFALTTAGFGSFAIFDGLATTHSHDEAPNAFALAATAIGIIVIVIGIRHLHKMTAWVDADEFGTEPAPPLPEEHLPRYLAAGAIIIGVISFIALLRLP